MNKNKAIVDKKNLAILILCFCVFIINAIFAVFMKAPVITDENGTMANAAFLSGRYNWSSSYTSSTSMYWGYGYSVLWIPLFYLFTDMFLVYRLIGVVNAIVAAIIPGIIYYFIDQNFPFISKKRNVFITLILGMHPISFVFTKHTWNEPMLLLLQWLILYTFFACCRNTGKKRVVFSIFTGFLCAYACTVHERSIAFFATIIISAILLRVFAKKRTISLLPYLFSFGIGYELHRVIKSYLLDNLLITENARNTAESLITKDLLLVLLNYQNLKQLLAAMFSQAYYIAASSFGLLFISLSSFFILIYYAFEYKNGKEERGDNKPLLILSIYTNAMFGSTLVISTLFYYKSYITDTARGLEYFFYGRYNESAIGIVLLLAILFIFSVNVQMRKILLSISLAGMHLSTLIILIVLRLKILKISHQLFNEINIYFFMPFGTSDFADHAEEVDFVKIGFSLLTFAAILWFLFIKKKYHIMIVLILCIYLFVDVYHVKNYLIPRNNTQYNGIKALVEYTKGNPKLFDDVEDIYLANVSKRTLTLQFVFPDKNVHFLNTKTYGYKQLQEVTDYSIVISEGNEEFEKWISGFQYIDQVETFTLWKYNGLSEEMSADKKISVLDAYNRELSKYSVVVNDYQSGSALYTTSGCVATQTKVFLNDGSVCFPNRTFLPHQYELEFIGNMLDSLEIEVLSDGKLSSYEIVSEEYSDESAKIIIDVTEEIWNGEIVMKKQKENSQSTFVQLNIIPIIE